MKATRILMALFVGVFFTAGVVVATAEEGAKKEKPAYKLVGVKKCKMCHNKKSTGAQYSVWMAGPHAKAYEVLASDEAKASAKELGVTDPQKDPKCLKCHATAFAVMDQLKDPKVKITLEEGVSCESCHGPGSGYKGLKVMKAVHDGSTDPASVGLWVPDEKVCVTCHTKEGNPNYKEFDFATFSKQIAHPIPAPKK